MRWFVIFICNRYRRGSHVNGCVMVETCSTHRKVEKPKMLVGKSGRKRPYVGPGVDGRIIP